MSKLQEHVSIFVSGSPFSQLCNTSLLLSPPLPPLRPPLPLPGPSLPLCTTGPIQCCDSVQSASSNPVAVILGLLGIVLQDLNIDVGLTCSPITIIGGGSNSCSANPVCCENNSFNGIVALGCVPVNINL
ncbi:hydrophobin [Moniliophthora roreri MCA 2997]|uniref:Hydrophobin n=1 Tax=Moniliophthora roreri (strain MCA 2997) TaxID=1381753 RepID=V2WQ87_MONRO|nr:hydrophobin [Moniliophthora roreri MCA 2997]